MAKNKNPAKNRSKCPREKNTGGAYSSRFAKKILLAMHKCRSKDQNYTVMCSGVTGGGKSTLMLHALELLGQLDYDRMAFDKTSMASSYQQTRELRNEQYLMYLDLFRELGFSDIDAKKLAKQESAGVVWAIDELKTYSGDHATAFNKDFFDLMMSVRFKNYFVWANAPAPESIQNRFLEEKVFDDFIYIYREQARFWWFSYKGFMRMKKEQGSYSASVIEEWGDRYAEFDGYFAEFDQEEYDNYEEYKSESVEHVEDKFVRTHGQGERFGARATARMINESPPTVYKYAKLALEEGFIAKEEAKTNAKWSFTEDCVEKLAEFIRRKRHDQ